MGTKFGMSTAPGHYVRAAQLAELRAAGWRSRSKVTRSHSSSMAIRFMPWTIAVRTWAFPYTRHSQRRCSNLPLAPRPLRSSQWRNLRPVG